MMRVVSELSDRELQALERGRQKRELVEWLRGEAASRDGVMHWYVARTNWRADLVAHELRRAGIEAVCPLERQWRRFPRSSKRYSVDIPLFGPHCFVRLLKAESAWVGLLTFDGVAGLQGTGEKPLPLRESEVAQVLALIENAGGQVVREKAGLSVGDEVVRPIGMLSELRGVVVEIDADRRQALVETVLFGRTMATRCGIDDLERLA